MVSRKTENRRGQRGYSGRVPTRPGGGITINERGQREYPERTPAQKRAEQAAARREVAADRRRQRERERAARAAGTGTDAPTPRKRTRPAAKKTAGPGGTPERPVAKKAARAGARRGETPAKKVPTKTATPAKKVPTKVAAPTPPRRAAPAKAAGRTVRKNAGTTVTPPTQARKRIQRRGRPGAAR